MPRAYAEAFPPADVRDHAAIVARRGPRALHAELWRTLPSGTEILCVVADDRPGLLSDICEVLVGERIEVTTAQVHCRTREDGRREAVDLFWLRRRTTAGASRGLSAEDVERIASRLSAPLPADADVGDGTDPGQYVSHFPRNPVPTPRAFFNTNSLRRGEYVLIVEAPDFPGLLSAITSALAVSGVEITASDIRTDDWLARDCFTLRDPQGQPLSPDRLAAIRQSVVKAIRIESEHPTLAPASNLAK
jgi:UTP:GlnB (protein PII) uridylyltransferase